MQEPVRLVANPLLRYLLFAAGSLSVALGVLGLFLPLLPTTPFMLLAAACYSRSSSRFYGWITAHPRFGPIIADYLAGKGLPLRARRLALVMLWLGVGFGCYSVALLWAQLAMLAAAVAVSWYLLSLPIVASPGITTAKHK